MVAVIFGTTGELIKLAPLLVRLERRGEPALLLSTGQQVQQIPRMLDDFGLRPVDIWLGRGHRGQDLERPAHIPGWLAGVGTTFARRRGQIARRLRSGGGRAAVLVHGDTMTTVLGASMGRLLGLPVGHVEAGMRSGNWRNPFPEEVNRRATARLATIHFAPGPRPVASLRAERVRGQIVDTGQNTIRDSLELAGAEPPPGIALPEEPFGIASLHRFELIERHEPLRQVLELLHGASRRTPILFVDHPTTAAAVADAGLDHLFDHRFRRIPRQRYFHFIGLLRRSRFLVTDSGGSQEECAFLGLPCLVHRAVTEHDTGLDGPVVLSRLDLEVVKAFLTDPDARRAEPAHATHGPSDAVVAVLERRGHLRSSGT